MGEFDYNIVEEAAKQTYIKALTDLPPDVRQALRRAYERETQPAAKEVFKAMFKAIEIADRKHTLVCQDTGLPIYMIKMGSKFPWNGAEIKKRLSGGASRATLEFPFRGSSTHILTRINPQNSVGHGLPVIYWDFVEDSDTLEMLMVPKGSGSENMSTMKMFIPADGKEALKKFVLDAFIASGSNPLPSGDHRRGHRRHRRPGDAPGQGGHRPPRGSAQQGAHDRRDGAGAGRRHQRHGHRAHGPGWRHLHPGGAYRVGLHPYHPKPRSGEHPVLACPKGPGHPSTPTAKSSTDSKVRERSHGYLSFGNALFRGRDQAAQNRRHRIFQRNPFRHSRFDSDSTCSTRTTYRR